MFALRSYAKALFLVMLASLLVPLAEAGVAVFVMSTFDTDYLLVNEDRLDAAVEVVRREGHSVEFP